MMKSQLHIFKSLDNSDTKSKLKSGGVRLLYLSKGGMAPSLHGGMNLPYSTLVHHVDNWSEIGVFSILLSL